jgi:hypothetical protein
LTVVVDGQSSEQATKTSADDCYFKWLF